MQIWPLNMRCETLNDMTTSDTWNDTQHRILIVLVLWVIFWVLCDAILWGIFGDFFGGLFLIDIWGVEEVAVSTFPLDFSFKRTRRFTLSKFAHRIKDKFWIFHHNIWLFIWKMVVAFPGFLAGIMLFCKWMIIYFGIVFVILHFKS